MTIYENLVQIAEANADAGYLRHYKDDLFRIDRETLELAQPNERFLWILRECGTALFPIAAGHDPVWVTYWLGQGNDRHVPSKPYLLTLSTGSVQAISYSNAERLACIPHPEGKIVIFSLFADEYRDAELKSVA